MYVQLCYPIVSLKTMCMFAPTSYYDPTVTPVFPSPHNTIEVVRRTKANALVAVPAFLEEWAISKEAVELLRKMEYVVRRSLYFFSFSASE